MQLTTTLGTKMAHYKENFLQVLDDGFVIRPKYLDTHLSYGVRCVIIQMCTSLHQLEIETSMFIGVQAKDQICQVCQREPKTKLHLYDIAQCTMRYKALFIVYLGIALDHCVKS